MTGSAATLLALAGQGRVITFFRPFADWLGGVEEALMLSQVLYWHDREGPDWWRHTDAQWQEELGLSPKQLGRVRKVLRSVGVESERRGMPAAQHYRVDMDAVSRAWGDWLQASQLGETPNKLRPKGATSDAQRAQLTVNKREDRERGARVPGAGKAVVRGVVLPEGSRPVFPSELADALEEHLGYPLDRKRWSAELRALAHDGVTPAQICAAYDWLNYDSYWDGRTFNLALIRRELPVMRARGFRRPGAPPPGGEPFAYSLAEREAWEAAGFRPRSALEAREWRDEHGWPQDGGRTDEEVHKWRREKGFV